MAKKPGCMAVVFVVIGLLFPMIGGCRKKKCTPKEFEQMALDYMNDRYQDSEDVFTVVHSNWDKYSYKVWIVSEKYKDVEIQARWNFERREFTDNYLGYVLKDEVEKKYLEVFAKVYGEENIRLEYEPGIVLDVGIGVQLSVDVSVEIFLSTLHSLSFSVICVGNPIEKEEKMREVLGILYEKGWGIQCRMYYVDEREVEEWREISLGKLYNEKRYLWYGDVYQPANKTAVFHDWYERRQNGY